MAKYEIEHICGHVEERQIYGTNVHGEREREAARLAAKPCAACVASEAAERAARNGEDGMAALKGSTKQIAWALDIREKMLRRLGEYEAEQLEKAKSSGMGEEDVEAFLASVEQAIGNVAGIEEARWFIDRRDLEGYRLMRGAFYAG